MNVLVELGRPLPRAYRLRRALDMVTRVMVMVAALGLALGGVA